MSTDFTNGVEAVVCKVPLVENINRVEGISHLAELQDDAADEKVEGV